MGRVGWGGRIVLAGPSGVGKTTVGALLARQAGLRFVDLDEHVVRVAGIGVDRIFEAEGEAGFRRREREAVEELAGERGVVLALGGGTVGSGAGALAGWPRVVLMAEVTSLVARLASGGDVVRPMLVGGGLARVEALWRQRMPGWLAFGPRLHTDGICADEVVRRVEVLW